MLQKFIFNVAIKKCEIFPLLCWIGPFLEYTMQHQLLLKFFCRHKLSIIIISEVNFGQYLAHYVLYYSDGSGYPCTVEHNLNK